MKMRHTNTCCFVVMAGCQAPPSSLWLLVRSVGQVLPGGLTVLNAVPLPCAIIKPSLKWMPYEEKVCQDQI